MNFIFEFFAAIFFEVATEASGRKKIPLWARILLFSTVAIFCIFVGVILIFAGLNLSKPSEIFPKILLISVGIFLVGFWIFRSVRFFKKWR